MEHILGKVTKIWSPVQRPSQDTIVEEWQIGDVNHPLDTRLILDARSIELISSALKKSNCGMVVLGGITWRIQVRKGSAGNHYGVVKLQSLDPRPMSMNVTT